MEDRHVCYPESGWQWKWVIGGSIFIFELWLFWFLFPETCNHVTATCPLGRICTWGDHCEIIVLPQEQP